MNSMLSKKAFLNSYIICSGILPLAFSVAIYLCFRSKAYFFAQSLGFYYVSAQVSELQRSIADVRYAVPPWCVYSLPDGLWTYAMTSLMIFSVRRNPKRQVRWAWYSFAPALSFMLEIAQFFHMFPGTFDIGDLVCEAVGGFIAVASISSPSALPTVSTVCRGLFK